MHVEYKQVMGRWAICEVRTGEPVEWCSQENAALLEQWESYFARKAAKFPAPEPFYELPRHWGQIGGFG